MASSEWSETSRFCPGARPRTKCNSPPFAHFKRLMVEPGRDTARGRDAQTIIPVGFADPAHVVGITLAQDDSLLSDAKKVETMKSADSRFTACWTPILE